MAEGLFRAEAVAAYRNPETRGGLLIAAPPSGRLPILLLGALLAGGILAASMIRVQVTARGRGIIRTPAGSMVVRAARSGVVNEVRAAAGRAIARGAPVARISGDVVAAPASGSVEWVDVRAGTTVASGDALAEIVPSGESLVAVMALPARHRARLRVGERVRLDLDEHPASQAGTAGATIEQVGSEPLTEERARALFGNADAAKQPNYLVRLRPDEMPAGVSGGFRSGMTFTGIVTLAEPRAIELVLPGRP